MDPVEDPAEEVDPLAVLMQSHFTRMQEISNEGFEKSKEMSGDMVNRLKKNVGLRDAVLDKTLTALGVTQPGETEQPQ
jgi:hypothetical protein